MPSFGKRSRKNLEQAHPLLQHLFGEVVKHYDCSVLCGHRTREEQEICYETGVSNKQWPRSTHNTLPSLAVDVVPYPKLDWKDMNRFYHFVGFVMGVAKSLGINIRSGADWDRDMDLKDQTFYDMPHFELCLD